MNHEPQSLASGRLIAAGVILVLSTAAVLVICLFLWRDWVVPDTRPANYPGTPRLQPAPARDLARFRSGQKNTDTWGWVDREHGVARIPVDRAMRLMAKERKP